MTRARLQPHRARRLQSQRPNSKNICRSVSHVHALHACLIYMYALYTCMPYIHVCLIYMYALHACLRYMCIPYMPYIHVCFIYMYVLYTCMPHTCIYGRNALYVSSVIQMRVQHCWTSSYVRWAHARVCLICEPYMHALHDHALSGRMPGVSRLHLRRLSSAVTYKTYIEGNFHEYLHIRQLGTNSICCGIYGRHVMRKGGYSGMPKRGYGGIPLPPEGSSPARLCRRRHPAHAGAR